MEGFPDIEVAISTPARLAEVIREIKRYLGNGELRQVSRPSASFSTEDVSRIPEAGPWPDYLEAHFEDRQGKRYRLTAETYHGAGGSWGPER
jgi:hypothetical protein